VPIVVLSLPHRKHHHYLVPSLAPWAILAAYAAGPVGLRMFKDPEWLRRPIFGLSVLALPVVAVIAFLAHKKLLSPNPQLSAQLESAAILIALTLFGVWLYYFGLQTKTPKWMLAAIVLGIGGAYSWSQTHLRDDTVADTQFLRNQVEAVVPKDKLLAIDAAIGPLDFFRVQFYLRGDAILLHNLTYLRSDKIQSQDMYVVAQPTDLAALQTLGDAEMLSESTRPPRKDVPHLALFHVIFSPDLHRYAPPPVSPMQAMMRQPGPWCGPPMP
jgi:4-amino-4-deoxy-L-arabinose transferase-like glycosyltransferase